MKRIRGLSDASGGNSFATLQGQFNAANAAARAGDQDAAKTLPGLSQALLNAAALVATSRQELDRVQAQTAASLEATQAAIAAFQRNPATTAAETTEAIMAAVANSQATAPTTAANDGLIEEVKSLREELAAMRSESKTSQAALVSATTRTANKLDDVTSASGGDAISVTKAAA